MAHAAARNRYGVDGIAAQAMLVRRTVERDHCLINKPLLEDIHADQCWTNHVLRVGNSIVQA